MAQDDNGNQSISVSVPMGVVATGIVIGLAAVVAYTLLNRDEDVTQTGVKAAKSSKGLGRKLSLMTAATLIENDATRKVVVAIIRAMARRS